MQLKYFGKFEKKIIMCILYFENIKCRQISIIFKLNEADVYNK